MFLDFDGTLVRIAPMPTGVRLEDETRDVLRKLAGHRNVTLAVISGRQRAELQRYIGIRNVKYMGLYGWESNGNQKLPFRSAWRWFARWSAFWRNFPLIPACGSNRSAAVFRFIFRRQRETQRQMRQQVKKRVKPVRETLQAMSNLRDVEVAPMAIGDKGMAVRKVLEEPAMRGALPIYFGDDISDETAFAAARNGIPVLVGKRRTTRARFSLRGPAEVAEALTRMEEIIR